MDDLINEEKLAILCQYKEILNESDDDIARATLESLDWNLEKAIEANDVIQIDSNGGLMPPKIPPAFFNNDDIEVIEPFVNNYKTKNFDTISDDDEVKIVSENQKLPIKNSLLQYNNSKKTDLMEADLDYNFPIPSSSANGTTQLKTSSSREDSGSGSTTSLANTANNVSVDLLSGSSIRRFKEKKPRKMSNERDSQIPTNLTSSTATPNESSNEEEMDFQDYIDLIPLIPTDFKDIREAMQNFITVFDSRYGSNHPPFYQSGLQNAIREAFEAPGRSVLERRPLAIYLHSENTIASNIFPERILCSDKVSSLLKCQYITWAWDMSQPENRKKLYEWMSQTNLNDVAESIKNIHRKNYPLLIILVKERGIILRLNVAQGQDSESETLDKLLSGLDRYTMIKNKDAAEERNRLEREQIRQEQVEEYEKSLATDRAKQQEQQRLRQEEEDREREQARIAEEKSLRQQALASSLPTEPPACETSTNVTVRFRFPNGEQKMRRFRKSEPIKWVVTFVESVGYDISTYRILNSDVPKKNIAEMELNQSFEQINWPPREQIVVEEK